MQLKALFVVLIGCSIPAFAYAKIDVFEASISGCLDDDKAAGRCDILYDRNKIFECVVIRNSADYSQICEIKGSAIIMDLVASVVKIATDVRREHVLPRQALRICFHYKKERHAIWPLEPFKPFNTACIASGNDGSQPSMPCDVRTQTCEKPNIIWGNPKLCPETDASCW